MRVFKDQSNVDWTLDLSVACIRRVKALLNIDLTLPQASDSEHGTLSQRLVVDVWLLVDVLWCVCKPQAEAIGITDEQFAERLGGDVLGVARGLLLEEWSDFFRSLGRADLAAAVAKTNAMVRAVGNEAVTQMDKLEKALIHQAAETMEVGGKKALAEAKLTMQSASGG
jgi:hypothetical protein